MSHEEQIELVTEILQLSRDGDSLSREELWLIQDATNYILPEDQQERLRLLAVEYRTLNV